MSEKAFINKNTILVLLSFLAFFYTVKMATAHLNNGRYVPMIIPHERTYASSGGHERDDKFYVLDTRTGKLCKPEYQGY